jgi:F420-dependent oxidoreductase-like protein
MKFGLEINDFEWPGGGARMGETLANVGRRAEAAGFDSIWVWDHFIQLRQWDRAILEGWESLAFLAGVTQRVMLGTLVTGVTYRHPAILVKQASTLDILSGGRAYLGIGAAWNEREHKAFGVEYGTWTDRFELLEDALQIAHRAWSGETGPFDGKRIHLTEQMDSPRPVQRPHPPILIGGGGERKTLRLVAKYADATHQSTSDPAEFRHKMDVLRRHCDDVGRDFNEIERYAGLQITKPGSRHALSAAEILDNVGQLADAGAQGVFAVLPRMTDPETLERFGEEVIARSPQPVS